MIIAKVENHIQQTNKKGKLEEKSSFIIQQNMLFEVKIYISDIQHPNM